MNRIRRRLVLTLCLLAIAGVSTAGPADTPPAGRPLGDSTTVDRWTLPNGLDVVARHVPGARAVSVTWGYRVGLDGDPADQPGRASLLAEVAFTAPAGNTPERAREEMASLRPLGWSLRVNRRQTLFTETASPAQLPGVLHQLAERMRGVTVTPTNLRHSLATVRAVLDERSRGVDEAALYWQLREHARGNGPDALARLAEAQALARLKPEDVRAALARAYVPANGVLALAGDLSGLDLHGLLAAQFGGLPAGERAPEAAAPGLTAAAVEVERPGVTRPVAIVGLFAPALTDTTHPAFYLAMLVLGSQAKLQWAPPDPPLETRFQYALLDDPGFVRFYPALQPGDAADARGPVARLDTLALDAADTRVAPQAFDALREGVAWLLGGPLPAGLLGTMRTDPAALNVLSTTSASRALWGDEDFWSTYRRRLGDDTAASPSRWFRRLLDPRLRACLLVTPAH